MLVLTRKPGDKIRIGNNILLTVISSNFGQIKIGIDAPQDIHIYREELYAKIQAQNKSSLVTDSISITDIKGWFDKMDK